MKCTTCRKLLVVCNLYPYGMASIKALIFILSWCDKNPLTVIDTLRVHSDIVHVLNVMGILLWNVFSISYLCHVITLSSIIICVLCIGICGSWECIKREHRVLLYCGQKTVPTGIYAYAMISTRFSINFLISDFTKICNICTSGIHNNSVALSIIVHIASHFL